MVDFVTLYTAPDMPRESEHVRVTHVPPQQFLIYNAVLKADPSYRASMRAIQRAVLGQVGSGAKANKRESPSDTSCHPQGMLVSKAGGKWKATPVMQKYFNNTWMIFLREALEHLSAFGLCVVDVREDSVPFVRKPHELLISELRWRDGRRHFRLVGFETRDRRGRLLKCQLTPACPPGPQRRRPRRPGVGHGQRAHPAALQGLAAGRGHCQDGLRAGEPAHRLGRLAVRRRAVRAPVGGGAEPRDRVQQPRVGQDGLAGAHHAGESRRPCQLHQLRQLRQLRQLHLTIDTCLHRR
jgi:hypothetical protein